jgi:hypothetical protein
MSVDQVNVTSPSPEAPAATPAAPVEAGSTYVTPPLATAPAPEVSEVSETFVEPSQPTANDEVERLLPSKGEPFELVDGTRVIANDLRLKEFLGMLKIVTRGAAIALGEVRLNTNDEDFQQSLISLFLFAIPEAEEEAADFLRLMVRPAGPFPNPVAEIEAVTALDVNMSNPELEDMFTIVEVVVNNEGKDLRRLGKRLGKALEFAQKTGQV